jgi:peptidoglycan glycosyltransferase
MDRAIKRVSLAVLIMFLLLLFNVNYLQAFDSSSLAADPENPRAASATNQYERGDIVTSDGKVIAGTKAISGSSLYKYQRYYSNGSAYAPVTGYDTIYGSSGVEEAEDGLLSGTGDQLAFRNFLDMITDKPQKGATVQLTVNSAAQEAAYAGLQQLLKNYPGETGGVVAINPSTGAILAMASYPSYDPNELTTTNGTELNKLVGAGGSLITESPSPLINNATQMTLSPGSTFKIITSSAWFTQDSSRNTGTTVNSPTQYQLPQTTSILHNDDDESCSPSGDGQSSVLYAFAESCDTTFGILGMDVGSSNLNSMAEKYGVNDQNLSITGVNTSASVYQQPPSLPLTAYSAIGQWNDTMTPLQEAMMSATIANNGTEMKPYLIQSATASDLSVVQSTSPKVYSKPISSTAASYVQQMMTAVMQQQEGTGYQFNSGAVGFTIAGKTGTAQTIDGQQPNSAFTGYAPAGSGQTPKIAVGVMISHGGYGASAAMPIAVNVMKAYLKSVGQ